MEKRRCNPNGASHLIRSALHSPGENRPPYPQTLVEVMESLVPKAACNRHLLNILRAYIFPVPLQPQPGQQEIRQHLQQALQPEEEKYLDIILTILEGMKAVIEYQKLQSPEELDSYLQAQKEVFGRSLLKKAGRPKPGRTGKTF